ncbi:Uncharacterized protein TCM_034352 [Theobroma cacao]|uniref:Uncharacterized protein n=1 Tax=Theobroma cacao TaxID=3641 RepID=A0A061FEU8_THECC|nr:Uncharacterized protein TCM_034352 [Theobroma cacao]
MLYESVASPLKPKTKGLALILPLVQEWILRCIQALRMLTGEIWRANRLNEYGNQVLRPSSFLAQAIYTTLEIKMAKLSRLIGPQQQHVLHLDNIDEILVSSQLHWRKLLSLAFGRFGFNQLVNQE